MRLLAFGPRSPTARSATRWAPVVYLWGLAVALSLSPIAASGQEAVIQVSAGGRHTCALVAGGRVKCWGDNSTSQLGDGTNLSRTTPVDVVGLSTPIAAIAAGGSHTCALSAAGGVKCWGQDYFGQLGDGVDLSRPTSVARSAPVDVVTLSTGVTAIAAGHAHTCALTTGGELFCWGANDSRQLGDSGTWPSSTPRPVYGVYPGVIGIAAGLANSAVVNRDGRVQYWGEYGQGMACVGSAYCYFQPVYVSFPVDAPFLGGDVEAVSIGGGICALIAGGRVLCWSPGSSLSSLAETYGFSAPVTAISVGGGHTCALVAGGIAQCWGYNDHGQLGDGTMVSSRQSPTTVLGLPPNLSAVSAGESHTCVITASAAVNCWGRNAAGQLGDGTTIDRRMPVTVIGLSGTVPTNSGWWWNAVESGRGFFIEQRGSTIVMAGYIYDDAGDPTWFLAVGILSDNAFTAQMQTYRNGQTLTGSYRGPSLGPSLGTITVQFTDSRTATVTWPGGTFPIARYVYASGGPGVPENGWWWSTQESGRGFSLEMQGNALVMAGYMYAATGAPIWYLTAGPMTTSNTYTGHLQQYAMGQSIGGPYHPPQMVNANVGTVSVVFSDSKNGMLTLPDGRQVAITRFAF